MSRFRAGLWHLIWRASFTFLLIIMGSFSSILTFSQSILWPVFCWCSNMADEFCFLCSSTLIPIYIYILRVSPIYVFGHVAHGMWYITPDCFTIRLLKMTVRNSRKLQCSNVSLCVKKSYYGYSRDKIKPFWIKKYIAVIQFAGNESMYNALQGILI